MTQAAATDARTQQTDIVDATDVYLPAKPQGAFPVRLHLVNDDGMPVMFRGWIEILDAPDDIE